MRTLTTLLAAAALTGCSSDFDLYQDLVEFPDSKPGEVVDPTVTDKIVQVTTPKVDVLFVIDNSCSMDPHQANLADNFPEFMSTFTGSGLDYHIGATSTDIEVDSRCGGRDTALNGRLAQFQGQAWIDENTLDPVFTFNQMALMGSSGSGCEKGLAAAYRALEERRDEENFGFYREDAAIHTVVVSDEQDQTEDDSPPVITLNEFKNWYDGLKQEVEDRTFSAVICEQIESNPWPEPSCPSSAYLGTRYADVTDDIGGLTWNILDENFGELLDELGLLAAGLKVEYYLSQVPVVDTIEVSIVNSQGGTSFMEFAPKDEPGEDTYYFDEVRNSIVFHEKVPDPLDTVEITYTPLSATQDPQFNTGETNEVPGSATQ